MNAAVHVLVGLAHLVERILQAHNARAVLGDKALGDLEHVAVQSVEALCYVAGQLDVLLLVCAHGHLVSLIEQNVARHERGICKQTGVDVVGVFFGLVLELRHSRKLAELGVAVEYPCKLGMGVDVALNEKEALFHVDAAGEDRSVSVDDVFAHLSRILAHGDCVKVCKRVNAAVLLLHLNPVAHRSEIVAQRDRAARLNRAEYNLFLFSLFHFMLPLTCYMI